MPDGKRQILQAAKDQFEHWEDLLGGMDEAQLTARTLPDGWAIKDVLAHLRAWQQRTIARLEAARQGGEPVFPDWPAHLRPGTEEGVQGVNDWVFAANRDRPWESVYREWRDGYLRFLALTEATPEEDLLAVGKYPWWKDLALAVVVTASLEHHQEHIDTLENLLG